MNAPSKCRERTHPQALVIIIKPQDHGGDLLRAEGPNSACSPGRMPGDGSSATADKNYHSRQDALLLAKVFADHQYFWNDTKLTVSSDLRRKLALFPINDPTISRLCGAFGQAQVALYYQIVEHINRGKGSRRLKKSHAPEYIGEEETSVPTAGQAEDPRIVANSTAPSPN